MVGLRLEGVVIFCTGGAEGLPVCAGLSFGNRGMSSGRPTAAGFRLRIRASKLPASGMALPPATGLVRALLIGVSDSQISADEPPAAQIRGATPLRVAVEDAVTNLVPPLDARTRIKGAPGRQPPHQEILAMLDAQLGGVARGRDGAARGVKEWGAEICVRLHLLRKGSAVEHVRDQVFEDCDAIFLLALLYKWTAKLQPHGILVRIEAAIEELVLPRCGEKLAGPPRSHEEKDAGIQADEIFAAREP